MPKRQLNVTYAGPSGIVEKFTNKILKENPIKGRGASSKNFSNLAYVWIKRNLLEADAGTINQDPDYKLVLSNMKNDLQQQFSINAKNARPVSNQTILRRRAFENLGEAAGHVQSDTNSPYREDVIRRAISNFTVSTKKATATSVSIKLSVHPNSHRQGQFEGLRSDFEGPNTIGISMTGLNVTNHKISTDDNRKMIIPIPDSYRDKANAILTTSGEFVMNSKKHKDAYASAAGLPVLFRDKLDTAHNVHHYNPVNKDRIVFWGVSNEQPVLTKNVQSVLIRRFFGK